MRTLIIGFLIFLCWLFFCRWYYVCQVRNQCGYNIEQVDDVRAKTLSLIDNGKPVLEGFDQLRFDSLSPVPVLNANNEEFIAKVADFLKKNPSKKITLSGHYLPSENDPTKSYGFFENLGLARADAIRQLLVKAGVDEGRINLDHNLLAEGATLDNPISFSSVGDDGIAEADNNNKDSENDDGKNGEAGTPDEFDAGGQQFSFTNMSFSDANFAYNSDKFKPGPAFISYADSVKLYLDKDTGKSLLLTGHTCDLGPDKYNMTLGSKRAKSVKTYFEQLGVKTTIKTASDGEANPAYKNDSEASRSKNRRVVVQIK